MAAIGTQPAQVQWRDLGARTPNPRIRDGQVYNLTSIDELQTLAAAAQLDTRMIYVDGSGNRYWALNATNFTSAGLATDSFELDFVSSGMILPSSGTIASLPPLTAGVAYVDGNRIALAATPLTFTATRDNYVDLRRDGTVIVTAVAVAAASPAIPVNCLRLGFVTTNATAATSSTSNSFDTLGNWMGNVTPKPSCRLRSNTLQGSGGAEISVAFPEADVFDNAGMHNPVTDNSRIVFPSPGSYFMSCAFQLSAAIAPVSSFALYVRLNGTTEDTTFPQDNKEVLEGPVFHMKTSGYVTVPRSATPQYAEFRFIPNGANATIAAAWLQCTKIS